MLSPMMTAVIALSESVENEPAIPPVAVGLAAFGLLMLALILLLAFAGGREHS
ncbi:MAG: hypothetical protein V9G04_10240 [Nocardioides sp.]